MNILIVGGAGYIGGALTDILTKSDHNIIVYDMLLYEESYRKKIPFVYGDIRDYNKLKEENNKCVWEISKLDVLEAIKTDGVSLDLKQESTSDQKLSSNHILIYLLLIHCR